MLSKPGRAEVQWSDRAGKMVLPADNSICGHKYIRRNMHLTKCLFAMTANFCLFAMFI